MELFTFDANHCVLEFSEDLTPPGLALELHLARPTDRELCAWWLAEDGSLLALQEVGQA